MNPPASVVARQSGSDPVNQADRGKVHKDESVDAPSSDRDGDGDPDSTDCAPEDSAVHDGAEELCNGIDDDCDGEVDEGTTGYVDADGDGFGALDAPVSWCDAPDGAGLAEESGDCDGCRSASVMRLPSQQGARRGTLSGGVPGNPLRVPNC